MVPPHSPPPSERFRLLQIPFQTSEGGELEGDRQGPPTVPLLPNAFGCCEFRFKLRREGSSRGTVRVPPQSPSFRTLSAVANSVSSFGGRGARGGPSGSRHSPPPSERFRLLRIPFQASEGGELEGDRQGPASNSNHAPNKKHQSADWCFLFGAAYEARTRYLHLGKVALYQMS